ncbi:MAG: TlpA family protein disulfide reductase, partial [Acidobacteria bacterium]|nr:TlpA family protein disulfide reductase [Acidobacteriota bacterium]
IRIDDGGSGDGISLNDPRVIKHSDGRIEIPEELRRSNKRKWLRGEEIVEFCGGFYLVDRVEPDGSALTLVTSDMKIPRVGEPLPALTMTTLNGQAINMKSLKGSATLLDFWASWCRPCVEKFAGVKQIVESYKGDIRVIAINVDESDRLPMAHQVIKEYRLEWPHVATGLGEKDPMWKVFGSMSTNGLAIPLYVLVDSNGVINYAGDGGGDLTELRAKVRN